MTNTVQAPGGLVDKSSFVWIKLNLLGINRIWAVIALEVYHSLLTLTYLRETVETRNHFN